MSTNPRYQALNNEDEEEENEIINQTDGNNTAITDPSAQSIVAPAQSDDLPPPYEPGADGTTVVTEDILNESPPLYTDIVKLPTYNESENIESDQEDTNSSTRSILLYMLSNDYGQQELTEESIGTDIGFIICFLVSFVFNGLGFIIAYCSTNSLSTHYGAVSGFGLSLVKWAFIAKHSEWSKGYFNGNEWLLYLIILFGWMIFLRGMFSYAQLKRFVYSRWRAQNTPTFVE